MNSRVEKVELDAAEDAAILDVDCAGAVGLQLTGTWVGTVSFEASLDGATFVAFNMVPSNSATAASSATGNGCWSANCGGYWRVRARMSAYTSGTAVAFLRGASSGGK